MGNFGQYIYSCMISLYYCHDITLLVPRVTNVNFLPTTSAIDYQRVNTLILNQILKRNVWRSVWRICMWILGLKGIIDMQTLVVEGFC